MNPSGDDVDKAWGGDKQVEGFVGTDGTRDTRFGGATGIDGVGDLIRQTTVVCRSIRERQSGSLSLSLRKHCG